MSSRGLDVKVPNFHPANPGSNFDESRCTVLVGRTGMGITGITRNARVFRGNGYRCCGNSAEMELKLAGFPRDGIYYCGKSAGCVKNTENKT